MLLKAVMAAAEWVLGKVTWPSGLHSSFVRVSGELRQRESAQGIKRELICDWASVGPLSQDHEASRLSREYCPPSSWGARSLY